MTATTASPGSRSAAWWLAVRPKTLTLGAVPVVVGTALAWAETGHLAWGPMLAALAAAVLIQAGTNLHNDAGDFIRGADGGDRLGPARATAQGWLSPRQVLRGAYAAFAAAFGLGVYLAAVGGWPIVAIGLAALAAGLAYTGGPRPIAYGYLGEAFVFLFFGLVAVGGSYYLQAGAVSPAALAAGAALGMFAAAVLVANNYRDLESDLRARRRTLVGLLGRPAARRFYALLVLLPFPAAIAVGTWATAALVCIALPLGLYLARRVQHEPPGRAFNAILARTAQLQLAYGLLLSLGLVLE